MQAISVRVFICKGICDVLILTYLVRGYEMSGGELRIWRLFWKTKIDLSGLISVDVNPDAMSKSLRTFGNGGLFSFSGAFWNKSLGQYRAYATNPANAVVLRFQSNIVVVTPEGPEQFAGCV